ncbi:ribonuclease domain-containing protein [Rhodococcus sp. NPDC058532]|uniref:ribonuclease domain-containing protein n=1 Tax=Rhodococcus sp. NPDC058532 TaxID=3346540 RepID=UPI00365E16A1
MTRFGARARAVLGTVVAIVAVVAGFLLTGPADDPGSGPATGSSTTTTTATAPRPPDPTGPSRASAAPVTAGPRGVVPVPVPDAAWVTLAEIDAGRWPGSADAPGTKGGDPWRNRDATLPRTEPGGASIRYREWDVNPKRRGETRDAERIVTGSDTSAWYTGDHYTSFVRMR